MKPQDHVLVLRDGQLNYDSLIIAPGTQNNYFGHSDWALHAPGLKSIEDATEMRRRILLAFEAAERETDAAKRQAWLTFVIVGGGPTGVELAGSVAEIARDTLRYEFRSIQPGSAIIMVVDAVDRVLPSYPPDLSAKAAAALQKLGVTLETQTSVVDIQKDFIEVKKRDEQRRIPARTVLWAAGVQASPLGQALARATGLPLERGGRLAVTPNLSLPGHETIFVIGDLAQCMGPDGKPLPGIAPVAMQEGRYVARLIEDRLNGRKTEPFHYVHKGDMATIGRAAGVADLGWIRFDGLLAWLAWLFIHLWFLVGFEDRLLVFTQWAWNYMSRNRSARLITGENFTQIQPPLSELPHG